MRSRLNVRLFINAGFLCLAPGVALALFGGIRTIGFLRIVHTYQQITARELLIRLILPHMLLLLGVGLVTAAFILITRAAVIRGRMRDEDV